MPPLPSSSSSSARRPEPCCAALRCPAPSCPAGGAFALEQIELLVQGDPRYKQYRSRIAGVMFDSAPCYMHATVGAAAAGQGRSPLVRLLAAALFYLSVVILFFVAPRQPQRFW